MEKQKWHKCRHEAGENNTRRWDISQSLKLWIKQQKYWPSSGAEFDSLSAFLYPHESSWIIARPKYFPEFMFFNVDKSKSWLFLTFRIFSSAIPYCTCHSIRHFNFPFLSSQFFMIFHLKYFPILFLFSLKTLFSCLCLRLLVDDNIFTLFAENSINHTFTYQRKIKHWILI